MRHVFRLLLLSIIVLTLFAVGTRIGAEPEVEFKYRVYLPYMRLDPTPMPTPTPAPAPTSTATTIPWVAPDPCVVWFECLQKRSNTYCTTYYYKSFLACFRK